MGIIFMINGAVNKTNIPSLTSTKVSASGKAAVALVYLFVMVYNMSWGPLPWYVLLSFTWPRYPSSS